MNTQFIDLAGKRYGRLLAVEYVSRPVGFTNSGYWKCKCDCGTECIVKSTYLRGKKTSCGCDRTETQPGKRYGKLVVISNAPRNAEGRDCWVCKCDCGAVEVAVGKRLRNKSKKSCGCLMVEPTVSDAELTARLTAHRNCERCGQLRKPDDFLKRGPRNIPGKLCRDCQRPTWRKRTLKKYGLSSADYDQMSAQQGGVCGICGQPPSGKRTSGNRLVVDHCHRTGRVRALLCNRGNIGFGYFQENVKILTAAIEYQKRYASPLSHQ